jgi:hypothetical protein
MQRISELSDEGSKIILRRKRVCERVGRGRGRRGVSGVGRV